MKRLAYKHSMCYNNAYMQIYATLYALFYFCMRYIKKEVHFMEKERACAITGHRPSRFKFKYSEDYSLCKKIKATMLEVLRKLHDEKEIRCFYVGGALGVDMWAAEQILRLKEQPGYEDIELVVVLPFVGHDAKWDQRSKSRMEFILQHCSRKEVIGNEDCRESYIKRNCYMVDQANYLVAVYDDERNLRSGTMQCVRYARKNHVPVVLIHPDTAIITW